MSEPVKSLDLTAACREGNIEFVNKMIAQLNNKSEQAQETLNKALLAASRRGHANIADSLLTAGASINYQDHDKRTPLIHASREGFTETVRTLIKWNAEIEVLDRRNWNALRYASHKGYYDVVEALINAGACVNSEDLKGRTALTLAASRSRTDVIKLLLFHNASVNHAAKNGTALIHATIQHSHKCMEVLLQGGADIECTCVARDGKTPLILASASLHIKTIKLLLAWNADINHENMELYTPLHYMLAGRYYNDTYTRGNFYDLRLRCAKMFLQSGAGVRRLPERTVNLILNDHVIHSRSDLMIPIAFRFRGKHCEDGKCILSVLYAAGMDIPEESMRNMSSKEKDRMPQFIKHDQEHTLELNLLCRRNIRRCLLNQSAWNQGNLFVAVAKLPLPGKLRKYLLFDIDI